MSLAASSIELKVQVRSLHDVGDMQACVDLQRQVWGYSDRQLVPDHIFVVAAKTGGQVFGAFAGDTLAGFALSFSAQRSGHNYLHSHMLAVLPEFQNRGVGRALKLAQREDALEKNIDCIEWTFDPFQLKNAHFNIARLGAIARHYLPDLYGRTSSPLHGGLPTDRLVAEWWVASPRVTEILEGSKPNPRQQRRIEVPANIAEIAALDMQRAERMQADARSQFQQLFNSGYAVTGLELERESGVFILEPYEN